MTESTISHWDNFLRIWAILGPLIAAAASAIWSRSRERERWEFEYKRDKERIELEHRLEKERFEQANTIKKIEIRQANRNDKYSEVKEVLTDFMASSTEFVRKQGDYIGLPSSEKHQAASLANDKFIYSFQLIVLLGDERLSDAATDLWNAAIKMPLTCDTNVPRDDEYFKILKSYQVSRANFNQVAREYLKSVDPHNDE